MDGLVHISQLASARVQKTSDSSMKATRSRSICRFDDRGRTRPFEEGGRPGDREDLEAQKTDATAAARSRGE